MTLTREDMLTLTQMMTDAVTEKMSVMMDQKLEPITQGLTELKNKVSDLKNDISELNVMVDRNYETLIRLCSKQNGYNTTKDEKIALLTARVDILENQTIKNTAAIRGLS